MIASFLGVSGSMRRYSAFGWTIRSEIALALPAAGAETACDFTIRYGDAPDFPETPYCLDSIRYGLAEDRLRILVPRTADFKIRGRKEMLIAPEPGVSETVIASIITGLVLGFLVHLNAWLTFHGSAVVRDNNALIFLGACGAGKSTTAAAFCRRGYKILCDDLVPISVDGQVLPGVPRPRLTEASYRRLFDDAVPIPSLWDGADKYQAELDFSVAAATPRVSLILEPWAEDRFLAEPVKGWKKISALAPYLQSLPDIDDKKAILARLTSWLGDRRVVRIRRPATGFRVDELLDLIETASSKETI